jgi:hypothetical protein
MAAWEIVLLAIVAVLVLLFLGGLAGNARARTARDRRLREHIAAADQALASARADDRGWDKELLEAAARAAFAQQRPGVPIDRLELIQVVDRPGTEEDRAAFQVTAAGGDDHLELVRSGGQWHAA